ncbi:MAG TPA: alkaline phosphatase family protein, partial [Candidatus Polarisedimenticolaceae bacterium]|nr:alkaline phosphatase family protein [Candidatus Polarisedimenticolaceae bacterium]
AGGLALAVGIPVGWAAARWLPQQVPDAINNRKGQTMWELARAAGRRPLVVRVPATFPAEATAERMLSGLGVPDMRGGIGTPTFYTSDPRFRLGDNEFSLELVQLQARRGRIETAVHGARNKPFYDFVIERAVAAAAPAEQTAVRKRLRDELDARGIPDRLEVPLTLEVSDASCTVRVGEQSQTMQVGEWSDWIELRFALNPLLDRFAPLRGVARFKLLQLEPELQLYLSPVNFHPDCHPVAFSWPPDYAEQLRRRFGMFKTLGWPEDTWSLPSGVGDERLFLEDMEFTTAKYEEMMAGLLADGDFDLYVQIFYFTDRIGHLFWRLLDEQHPLYDAQLAARYGGEVLRAYQRMDAIVGKARERVGPDTVLLVCSDHGFASFRRGVNYNNWLMEHGFLTLKTRPGRMTLEKLFDTRELFTGVDWSKTKAYAIGLGGIYINLLGRERQGIVMPGAEYDEVRRQIREGLEGLVDPQTGEHPVERVWTREELYSKFDPRLIPDLRPGNTAHYRVSWQTTLGGFGEQVIEENRKAWSGDHCSNDPRLVPGILFTNRKLDAAHPRMVDVMPTVLRALEVPVPDGLDGRPLW